MSGREAYIRRMRDELGRVQDQLEELHNGATPAKSEAEVKFENQVAGLQEKLEELNFGTESNFEILREGFEHAWHEIRRSFSEVYNQSLWPRI